MPNAVVSVRELITELAHIEDAVRRARTATSTSPMSAVHDARLRELRVREDEIVAALRVARRRF